ncbi:DM13 domain-containing protein [Strongyloides ratti]|uniref:DM13 domain-containing protein n=1 Tax=Strongyloides ratti TaxID=34506 RepID=A0A090LTQ5_STRRB|nr:DM13 domain-containing protein [Strongyloides ratti]CEF71024.1 DM13 domain-containing protein [Strongyloides ratti]
MSIFKLRALFNIIIYLFYNISFLNSSNNVQEYFGMPVGAIYYGIGKMSGEIYAGDYNTIYINRYHHNPKEKGCFALMVGPATENDIYKSYSIGNYGILLSKKNYTDINTNDISIVKRNKRGWKNVIETNLNYNNKEKITNDNSNFNSPDKLIFKKNPNAEYRYHPNIRNDNINEYNNNNNNISIPITTIKPKYWVIDDPRAARKNAKEKANKLRGLGNYPSKKNKAFSTKTINSFNYIYELPITRDSYTIKKFYLPSNTNITDYKWIGLYDKCVQKTIPLLTLKDIEPPKAEKIAPLSGWEHNITSYRVQVLNCNTILIPGFTFDANSAFSKNTFMYVGMGSFPEKILSQYRAHVNNQNPDIPLRFYNHEDIYVTLPLDLKTFDVDFLSIYNDDEKKSYGNIILPSVLVPPCLKAEDETRLTGKAKQI